MVSSSSAENLCFENFEEVGKKERRNIRQRVIMSSLCSAAELEGCLFLSIWYDFVAITYFAA